MTTRLATPRLRPLACSLLALLLAGANGCSKDNPTTATPNSPPSCTFMVGDGPSRAMAAMGGDFSISIATQPNCSWSASSSVSFISVIASTFGFGSGTARFTMQDNLGAARSGSVVVAGRTLTIQQESGIPAACGYTVAPLEASIAKPGGDVLVTVTVTSGQSCSWTASSNTSFITVRDPTGGSGSGSAVLSVASNTGPSRSGTATVAGRTITVLQESGLPAPCVFSVAPTSIAATASGGSQSIGISVIQGTNCAWTAQSNASFVAITGVASGIDNGSVSATIAANAGPARTGTLTIAGEVVTVTQDAPPVATKPVAVLSIQSDPGDYIGAGATISYSLDSSQFTARRDSVRGELHFSMTEIGAWRLTMAAPSGSQLLAGTYDRTARWPLQPPGSPGLDFSGMGRGCLRSTGRFLVSQAVYGPGNTVQRFHARFQQHCEGYSSALRGEIWIDSQGAPPPPISPLPTPSVPTTFFSYQSEAGDPIGGGESRTIAIPEGNFHAWLAHPNTPATVNINLSPSIGASFFWGINFQGPSGTSLQPGTYTNARAYFFNPPGSVGMSVSGNGFACLESTGSFVVLEATYGPQREVLRFHATFDQRCGNAPGVLRGEIRIVADPWR